MNNVLRISRVKNSFCDATIPGLIRNGKEKKKRKKTELLYTYIQKKKRTPERVCCHGSFSPLPLVTVRNATERDAPVVLCSLVSPL